MPARRLAASQSANLCQPASLQGWQFGAVYFLSARVGIGITAPGFICPVPSRGGTVTWRWQSQPVRLAVTHDGGETWRAEGAALADGSSSPQPISEQVVAGSTTTVYALTGDGEVLGTSNAGATWTRQPVPRPAFQLAVRSGTVWSLACPTTPTHATAPAVIGVRFCRPRVARASARGGPWTQVSIPPLTDVLNAQLTVVSNSTLVLGVDYAGGSSGELLFTLDGGQRWSRERDPAWHRYPCSGTGVFTAAPPRTWWILCLGGAAAGSSTKRLLRTTDNGRTWTTLSQVTSLVTPAAPSSTSISRAEPDALAAGSSMRLWLAYQNSMGESADGGTTWTNVPDIDPQGVAASFDVLSSTHAWLAAPGEGLWRTTDGTHWTPTTVTNVSPSTCSLDGYPTIALVDDHDVRLALRYRDGGDQLLTSRPPHPMTLAPLDEAYEAINKNACVGHASDTAARIRFTLPHAGGTLTMALARYPMLDYCPTGDPGHMLDIGPFEPVPDAVSAWYR